MSRLYLDYNATAPIRPEAAEAVGEALSLHNASAVYAEGREARAAIEKARGQVSALCKGGEVIFTSGGTEACNLAFNLPHTRLIVGATEHAAVLHTAQTKNADLTLLPVDKNGIIDMGALHEALRDSAPALVCVQAANNETGVLQPIAAIAEAVREHGSLFFCDAIQAAGKIDIDINAWGCDALALSAHKIGGAMGAGALVVREGITLEPALTGGGQELGLRAGTENVSGIVAFGVAAECAAKEHNEWGKWRDELEKELRRIHPALTIFGEDAPRLDNTSCFAVAGTTAETLLMKLDLAGVAISSGAACSSGKVERSHVLAAMGVEETLAAGALRVSFGWQSEADDVARFISHFAKSLSPQQAA